VNGSGYLAAQKRCTTLRREKNPSLLFIVFIVLFMQKEEDAFNVGSMFVTNIDFWSWRRVVKPAT
jgi:hypothetical protein